MKKTRRFISIALALVMCLALVPVTVGTAEVKASASVRGMTEAERKAAIDEIIDFSGKLVELRKEYAVDYASRADDGCYATCRIVVKAKGDIDTMGALAEVTGHNDWHVLQYATPEEAEAACKQLAKAPGVEYAVPDTIMHIEEASVEANHRSWGYNANNVNADSFNEWLVEYYGGEANIPTVTVAVIDTGVDSDHPFIMDRLVPGYDFSNNDANPEDDHYHGTHVAGIVTDGTLSNVKIMPIKVLDDTGYGETITVVLGIEYAYLHGCDVENMSLGGDCDGLDGPEHIMMRDAIYASVDAGTVVCVAAGNETDDATYHCPANIDRAFTIASITSSHTLSYFSNYGQYVDIMAPGSDVSSANMGGGFATHSGTSMACPHAAAACAMVKSYDLSMQPEEVMALLENASVDIGISNAGAGMLCVTDLLKFDIVINQPGQNNHFYSTGTFPWKTEGDTAYSGNAGRNNTVSTLTCKARLGAYQVITFDYKISSQQGADFLRFKANGETLLEVSGEHDWQTATVEIPASGSVELTWEYSKDASGEAGSDTAYIRSVRIDKSLSTEANAEGGAVQFTSSGAYPWIPDAEEGAAKSGNAGVHNSVSQMNCSLRLKQGMIVQFEYRVSSSLGDNLTVSVNGSTVIDSGSTSGYRHFEYSAPFSGVFNMEFKYTKNASGSSGSDCAWIRGFKLLHTFDSAANGTDYILPIQNMSNFPWVVQDDYIMSGNAGRHSTTSSINLNLAMQAGETLTFRYAVSSEDNYDFFRFYVDNVQRISASGVSGWIDYTFTATQTKTYSFRWSYEKDSSVSNNDDCAYLDNIIWSGGFTGLIGDVDLNGEVNANDALILMRYTLGLIGADQLELRLAEVNGDGVVNVNDALVILRASLGLLEL